jgi:hypothetical protein
LAIFCGAPLLPGCEIEHRLPPPEPVNSTPLVIDQAMVKRDWQPARAHYTNDVVMAFPDYSPLRAKNNKYSSLVETPLFLANIAYMAYGVFVDPPWEMVGYKSMSMEPTYTAMPPLPPSTVK